MEGSPATNALDAALVARMARGDRNALADLYDRHAGHVMALALRLLRNRAQAEDLVHEVFLEAWRCSADYDERRGSVLTWLLLRARSRGLDLRRRYARGPIRDPVGTDGSEAASADPSDDPERTIEARRAIAAMESIADEEVQVIVLGYFEGLSSAEIAQRAGIPIGTVKSRTRAALSKLRARLGAGGESR